VAALRGHPEPAGDDAGAVVQAAQEKLRRAVQTAGVTGDPLTIVLEAQIAMLDAQHRLHQDNVAAMQQARQPIGKDDLNELLRRAVYQMDHSLTVRAVQLQRGVIAGATAAAVALVAIGWLAAGWWHPRADISGMTCQDEANGGRVCYMWVTPPPGPAKP